MKYGFKRVIGENYMTRWHLIPRNRFCNVYLHRYVGSDDGRACHDHPWGSVSFLLKGKLREIIPYDNAFGTGRFHGFHLFYVRSIRRFVPVFRSAKHIHRLELEEGPAWTVFLTGPVVRPWYFHCARGMVHHREYDARGGCE